MATITTDDQLTEEIGKVAAGQQAGVPKVDPVLQTPDATTVQPTTGTLLDTDPLAPTMLADTSGLQVAAPTKPSTDVGQQPNIERITPNIGTATAA